MNVLMVNLPFSGHTSYLYVIPKPEVISRNVVIPYEKMKSPIVYISLGSILSDKSFYKNASKHLVVRKFMRR